MRARLAWLLVGASAVALSVDTVLSAITYGSLVSERAVAVHGWPLVLGAAFGSAVMGALIVSRHPRHLAGWLLVVVGITSSMSLVTETYSIWVIEQDGSGPEWSGHIAAWLSVILGAPLAIACLTVIFLVVPDGRFLTPRWRYVALAAAVGVVAFVAGTTTNRSPLTYEVNDDSNAEISLFTIVAILIGLLLVVAALLASVAGMVRRLRRSQGETRQQLRWIAASAASIAVAVVFYVVVQVVRGDEEQTFLASTPLFAAYFLLPICIAVAVLRHRLYDIDLIINRTLVVAIGAAFAALGYVGLVVGVGNAVGSRTGGFWPSLLATVVVALAFQPLRRRVVRVADRLAYGRRAAPYEALGEFSRRLADTPSADDLLQAVAEAAGHAAGATRSDARLAIPGHAGEDVVATWAAAAPAGEVPGPGEEARVHEIAVTDRGERLGSISVTLPAGRLLREGEAVLLADLADQAAVALRNAALEAAVADNVERLQEQTRDLAASRSRLIEARDRERDRLSATISRRVLPHLLPLPDALRELEAAARLRAESGASSAAHVGTRLDQLMAGSGAALDALREITRGVFPTQLSRSGLAAALTAHLSGSVPAGTLEVHPSAQGASFPPRVEAAAYFCYIEAARGLGAPVSVVLSRRDGQLSLQAAGRTLGAVDVQHLRDRTEPLGGVVRTDVVDQRTLLHLTVPCEVAT
jgi:hypothetical protein